MFKNPQTIVLHGAYRQDSSTGSVAVPIYQTTSYQFKNTQEAADLFALKKFGNIYSRIMNPTCDLLEKRLALLEGGAAALVLSSGQTAATYSILNICQAGDNIVSSNDLYGGTWTLFNSSLRKLGIEVRFVDIKDPNNFKKASDDKTKAYFGESLPNPKLNVFPIKEVSDIGHNLGIPLIIDNTAAPVICRPLDHGADIVIYSTTKYIGGHGTSIGGAIIDGGKFNWENTRFPLLNEPDNAYHGIVWSKAVKEIGPIAYILKARVTLLRDMGGAMSPFNAFNFIQGMETLPLRMKAHCENALQVAKFLKNHSKIDKVIYPYFSKNDEKVNIDKYLKNGYGGLIGFELKGEIEEAKKFINNLKMIYHVANIGDVRSLAIHPASTTHQQMPEKEMQKAGVTKNYIRLSIGIEHIDDIIADISQSLKLI